MISLQRLFLILAAVVLFVGGTRRAYSAQAYIIVDSQTGYVLDERQSRQKRQIGSLTKIATAMVVLDWSAKRGGDLNQLAAIPPEA